MKHFIFLALCLACLSALDGCRSNPTQTEINNPIDVKENKMKYYSCFLDWNLEDCEMNGNEVIFRTPQCNFYKYTTINDSEFIFSSGIINKQIELGKYKCTDRQYVPEFVYDNAYFMLFFLRQGSDNWQYEFVSFVNDTVYSSQALYIDSINMRYAEMQCIDSSYDIILYNFDVGLYDTIRTKYNTNNMVNPNLHFKGVSIDSDKVYYNVFWGDSMHVDTGYLNCPCL